MWNKEENFKTQWVMNSLKVLFWFTLKECVVLVYTAFPLKYNIAIF